MGKYKDDNINGHPTPSFLLLPFVPPPSTKTNIYVARKQAATAAAEQIRSAKEKKNNAVTIRFTPTLLPASLPDDNTRVR
jgi:hypothetical protein